ncbi:hypothetical protein [Flavobacterium branchiophilum]|uniref:Uncharacterized protein n=1 Tax=Flavobacterium branchiophilum TaxID=55197 RepID=A0A2H3KL38_9FLAO|nr:hypothetical protein [Flavobacterium branchiophilum]PDS26256.1 hypothetical protein B0A77_02790 [Flavobacterium branchiophilum]
MKLNENLQKLLPFGYIFLVVLGIIKESVYYYQFGINILKYSNIMDILISPIADLTSHPIILFVFITYLFSLYLMVFMLSKNYQKEWVRKIVGSKKSLIDLTENEVKSYFGKIFILMFAIGLLSFFLGIGIGNGIKVSKKISKNELKYDNEITFNSNETKQVYLIGSNSANYFYVEKGNNNVQISPVGAIKTITLITNKQLNEKSEIK